MIIKRFQGMTYRELQRFNSEKRSQLDKENQIWLKVNKYKNIGWNKIIELFRKIEDLQDKDKIKDWSLEELFLESDTIGNKYLTDLEINDFNFKLAKEVNKISELIDLQFPDSTIEIIDYSK
jgi:predicted Rossmann fold nucleotide-binding protein DprA/Smf involved in DNA uptake